MLQLIVTTAKIFLTALYMDNPIFITIFLKVFVKIVVVPKDMINNAESQRPPNLWELARVVGGGGGVGEKKTKKKF